MDVTAWFLIYILNSWCGPNVQVADTAVCYDLDGDLDVDLADYAIYQTMQYDCETIDLGDGKGPQCAFIEPTYEE